MRSKAILVSALLFFCFGLAETKAVVFDDGETHLVDSFLGEVSIYDGPGLPAPDITRVEIVENGLINPLYAYESSEVLVAGGLANNVFAYGESSVLMSSGGMLGDTLAYENSKITISGGNATGMAAKDNSNVTISGGFVADLGADNFGHVNYSGGYVDRLFAFGNSEVTISGDVEWNTVGLRENSQTTISGGNGLVNALDSSQVTISGGRIYLLTSGTSTTVIQKGATLTWLSIFQDSQVTISGGSIGRSSDASLEMNQDSITTIMGQDFMLDGTPLGYGTFTVADFTGGNLSGTLLSEDFLDVGFSLMDNASLVLVPEPTTLLLLSLGAVIVRRKRSASNLYLLRAF